MAKSQRSSVTKANNQRLKKNVFGPVEAARQQRLSARLLEIASQPKPVPEKDMKDAVEQGMFESTCQALFWETGCNTDIFSTTAETEETKAADETKQDGSELDHPCMYDLPARVTKLTCLFQQPWKSTSRQRQQSQKPRARS